MICIHFYRRISEIKLHALRPVSTKYCNSILAIWEHVVLQLVEALGGVSILDGVIWIFHWVIPSGHAMALGSTQPLAKMSTKNTSWGKGGRCVGLTTTFMCRLSWNLGASTFLEHSVTPQTCNGIALPLAFTLVEYVLRNFDIRTCFT
jgi:hypothetical protein